MKNAWKIVEFFSEEKVIISVPPMEDQIFYYQINVYLDNQSFTFY